jgi:tubulin alpha
MDTPPPSSCDPLFSETRIGTYVPRAVFMDLEPTVIDEIQTGPYRRLFQPGQLIHGSEDAANNYGRGHCTIGKQYLDRTLEAIRHVAESCSGIQGLLLFHSLGGGTGSGFGSLLSDEIFNAYPRKRLLEFTVYPSPTISTAVVEPYNAVFAMNDMIDVASCSLMFHNEALYDLCRRFLDVERPTYTTLNRLIAQVASSLTCFSRFEGAPSVDIPGLLTNLIPYPNIHYLPCSYGPMITAEKALYESKTVSNITDTLVNPEYAMVKFDPPQMPCFAYALLYRGDVLPMDVNSAVEKMKSRQGIGSVLFDWTLYNVSINFHPPTVVPGGELPKVQRTLCVLMNTLAVAKLWHGLSDKFSLMYSRRAFIHWYLREGMEEATFAEAREQLRLLTIIYEDGETHPSGSDELDEEDDSY